MKCSCEMKYAILILYEFDSPHGKFNLQPQNFGNISEALSNTYE